jgi:hypothetical protein
MGGACISSLMMEEPKSNFQQLPRTFSGKASDTDRPNDKADPIRSLRSSDWIYSVVTATEMEIIRKAAERSYFTINNVSSDMVQWKACVDAYLCTCSSEVIRACLPLRSLRFLCR